ncbi:hypothetical protein [Streptomyces canus]|uniref:hypothetical protein n=1 Tax=Streptomyces canus TaxID=58343 RepID=UPI00386C55F2
MAEDLVRPGLVEGDADTGEDVDGVLVVTGGDVRGGHLAGGLDVPGAGHVRSAVVHDQVMVQCAGGLQVRGLEVGVGQFELAPAVLGPAVAALAALPGLVAAGEVHDEQLAQLFAEFDAAPVDTADDLAAVRRAGAQAFVRLPSTRACTPLLDRRHGTPVVFLPKQRQVQGFTATWGILGELGKPKRHTDELTGTRRLMVGPARKTSP